MVLPMAPVLRHVERGEECLGGNGRRRHSVVPHPKFLFPLAFWLTKIGYPVARGFSGDLSDSFCGYAAIRKKKDHEHNW